MTNEQVREIEELYDVVENAEAALPEGFRVDTEHTLEECIEELAKARDRAWTWARKHRLESERLAARIEELEAAARDVLDQRQRAFDGGATYAPYVDLRRLRDLVAKPKEAGR